VNSLSVATGSTPSRIRVRASRRTLWSVVAAFVVASAWNLCFGLAAAELPGWRGGLGVAALGAAFLGFYVARRGGRRAARRRAAMRLRAPCRAVWPWVLPLALLAATLQVAIGFLVVANGWITEADAPKHGADASAAGMFLFGALFAPLVEEFFYRGTMQRALERRVGPWLAIGVTALVFALAHGNGVRVPGLWLGGVVLGHAAWATRSIWPGVAIHVINNVVAALVAPWLLGRASTRPPRFGDGRPRTPPPASPRS